MATFTLLEFGTVTANGEPVFPASKETTGIAEDTPTRLQAYTKYAVVIPSADMYLGVGGSGVTAAAGNGKVLANVPGGFNVSENARPYVAMST